jgi:outer membrane biogenesis lipoprotein LolB
MTMRKLQFFVLLATVLLLSACSSGGSDSPSDNNAHPESWFSTHAQALTDPGYDRSGL